MKLDACMSIRAMARKADVPYETMRRRLRALDQSEGGVFVQDRFGKSLVDTRRVLSLCDDFFGKYVATESEVELLRIQLHGLRDRVHQLAQRMKRLEAERATLTSGLASELVRGAQQPYIDVDKALRVVRGRAHLGGVDRLSGTTK